MDRNNLEEKFQNYINTAQKNYDFTISPSVLIYDLAKIAEKYYVGEVLRPAMRADKLEQQLEGQEIIAEGVVSIEKDTTVFVDGLSLEAFIDAEICQRIKKYQGKKVKLILEATSQK